MATIKDVARLCGFSQATVSQVLHNGARPVHPKTRERVLQAAQSLNYSANAVAQGLARKRMNTIGLAFEHGVGSAHANPFLMMVLDGVLFVSTRRRQSTMLCTTGYWDSLENLPGLGDGRCDGVLLLVPPLKCALTEILQQRGVPFVVVSAREQAGCASRVDIDNVGAARELTEYLLHLGHQRIAFVWGEHPAQFSFGHDRQEGYRQAMAAQGLYDPGLADFSWEQAQDIDLSAPGCPTALFCAYDAEAVTAIRALQSRGVRVPEDVSVAGFDDIPEAAMLVPALTTVRQPVTQIGECAAEMLLAIIDGDCETSHQKILPTELIIRGSTAPPRR